MQFASRLILNAPLGTAPGKHFYGKNRIHGTGAKAGAIERDVFEAGLLESRGDCIKHIHCEGAGQLSACEFDAGQLAVMANAQFAKAKLTQALFSLFNLAENFAGDGAAILDAG